MPASEAGVSASRLQGLGAVSVAMCILSMLKYAGDQPLWYSIALMFLSIPSVLIGGYYRALQVQDLQ